VTDNDQKSKSFLVYTQRIWEKIKWKMGIAVGLSIGLTERRPVAYVAVPLQKPWNAHVRAGGMAILTRFQLYLIAGDWVVFT